MTATQAPTPGPLSGDDVNRECKACGAFKPDLNAACTFCGLAPTAPVEAGFKTNADGEVRGFGGVKVPDGTPSGTVIARVVPADPAEADEPQGKYLHWDETGPEWVQTEAPTVKNYRRGAPAEASGSERDGYVAAFYEIADMLDIGAQATSPAEVWSQQMRPRLESALRPQPSGETRPTDEEIRSAIKATEYKYFGDYEFTEDQHAAVDVLVRAGQALLSARSLALGGQQGEEAAWSWLNQHVECDPADRDYSADEMVDAFMAGNGRYDRLAKALERIAGEQQHRSGYCQTDITVEPALTAEEAQTVARDALSTTPARAEAQSDDLRTACQAVLDDYQTSDAHHPDHVLIRRTDFERIKVLVEAPVVVQAARDLVRQAHEILRSGNPPFSAREVNARGKLRDALNPDRARAEAQGEGAAGELRAILRNVVAHATGGSVLNGDELGLNDICCRITHIRNKVYLAGKESANPSPTPAADDDRVQIAVEALSSVVKWGESRCPCYNDLPDPCPLCDASVANLESCKSAEKTFPPKLLGEMRQALAALKAEGK